MVSTLTLQQVCRSAVWCLTFLTCDSSGAESCPLWSLSDYRRTDRHWERSGLIETGGEKEVSIVTTDSSLISVSSYLCTLHYLSVSSCLTTAAAGPGAPMFTPRPSQLEKQEQLWCCSVLLLCPWLTVCERVCVHPCVCVCFLSKSEVIRMTNDPESGRARTGVKCPLLFSDVCVNTVRVEPQECQRRAEWCRTGNNRPSNTTCWHKSRSGENLYWMRCLGRKQHRRQNNTRYTLSTKSQRLHLHYMVYPTHCRM